MEPKCAGGWFSIMMALIFGAAMLLWFWGSTHKIAFFASHFNAHVKKLEDLLAVVDAPDLSAPPKLRLVAENKPVSFSHSKCLPLQPSRLPLGIISESRLSLVVNTACSVSAFLALQPSLLSF